MEELFGNLGIDGKLLLAQAVNFLLLLFLLNQFVFKKLFVFLEKRRIEIEKGISLKAKAEQELDRVGVLEQQTLQQARTKAEAILSSAGLMAQDVEKESFQKAKSQEERILKDAKKRAERETEELMQSAQHSISEIAFMATERVLAKALTKKEKEKLQKEAFIQFGKEQRYGNA
ncbi:MAG: F0F1 ATP synthase subunit B [bacterium]|nr:F0F1 ATP synthase subunit B [bacterium]